MKKRKRFPSGRNCGQRWLPWPAASCVTATGVPPVAATRISGLNAVGANTMMPSRLHVPPRLAGHLGEDLRCATSDIDTFQFAAGKKANRATIECPEWDNWRLRSRRAPARPLHRGTAPRAVTHLSASRDEYQLPAVGREREWTRVRWSVAYWISKRIAARLGIAAFPHIPHRGNGERDDEQHCEQTCRSPRETLLCGSRLPSRDARQHGITSALSHCQRFLDLKTRVADVAQTQHSRSFSRQRSSNRRSPPACRRQRAQSGSVAEDGAERCPPRSRRSNGTLPVSIS